jgi:hypothetical protein
LLTGGAGSLKEIERKLAAQREQQENTQRSLSSIGTFIFQYVGIIGDRNLCCLHLHNANIKHSVTKIFIMSKV